MTLKNRVDIQQELSDGTLETALDGYAQPDAGLYAVTPAGLPSRRVAMLIEFLAQRLPQQ